MNSKIKNIIIFLVVAVALVLVYIFFIKKGPVEAPLTSSSGEPAIQTPGAATGEATAELSEDFVSVLLSVKSIKLDDSILKDESFISLRDSSIILVQDGNEGRPNPFAPIGTEAMSAPVSQSVEETNPTNTPDQNTGASTDAPKGSKKN